MPAIEASRSLECPECGVQGSGRYCAECAAPLLGAQCKSCATPLVAGARYCHHCGSGAGPSARSQSNAAEPIATGARRSRALPWAVGVGAFVALAGLVVWQRSADAGAATGAAPSTAAASDGGIAPNAPDISAMSPRERAERLYDRAMMAKQSGKLDSATFFATMATLAYGQLGELTIDDHYDLGRLALLAGSTALARAEADTMLAQRPTHLLGLMLAEDASRAAGDARGANAAHAKLLANAAKEQRLALPEYRQHAAELSAALDTANTGASGGGKSTTP